MISSSKRLHVLALLACIVTCLVFTVEAQLAGKLVQNPCVNKRTCHECIQTQSCAWCMQPDHGDKPRCFQHSYSNFCPEQFIWNPDTVQSFTINRELTRASYAAGGAGGQMSYGSSYYANSSYSSSSSGSYSGAYGASGAAGSAGSFSGSNIVQISPQRVSLKLRISKFVLLLILVSIL